MCVIHGEKSSCTIPEGSPSSSNKSRGHFQQKKDVIEVQVVDGGSESMNDTTPVAKEQETNGTVASPAKSWTEVV